MRGRELVRKIEALGNRRGVTVSLDRHRGKGSHQTLYFGSRKTVIPDPARELKTGTYKAILKQLGLEDQDLV